MKLELFDRHDDALASDDVDHREDTRQRSRIGKIYDCAFEQFCSGQRFGKIIAGWQKDIGDLEADGIAFVYQRPSSLASGDARAGRES